MPLYLRRFSYTHQAWKSRVAKPEDRTEQLVRVLAAFGGELRGFWFAFGSNEGYILAEFPDHISATGCMIRAAASGIDEEVETLLLLTPEEMLQAQTQAAVAAAALD